MNYVSIHLPPHISKGKIIPMKPVYHLHTEKLTYTFEMGPIRPPSEAYSLLIRATRNCPWNKCQFCHAYRGCKFELRPVDEIIRDIEAAQAISQGIKEIAWKAGNSDGIRELAAMLCNQPQYGQCVHNVALWLYAGGESAFLQDSDTLIMRTPELVQVITFLRHTFPNLNRVTSYARSHTSARKSLQELRELKEAGLDRIHTGLETGYDPLLAYMQKGATAEQHILGGRKLREAGISLCEYIMPGLGGKEMTREHVSETARVLNEINPDYIRLRSLHIRPNTALWAKLQNEEFEPQTEDEVVEEIGNLIENLHVTSQLKSDHILNLLMEVEGKMPEDKEKCLNIINKYLSLPDEERLNFKLGRRAGYYENLSDLNNGHMHDKIEKAIKKIQSEGNNVEELMLKLKGNFI